MSSLWNRKTIKFYCNYKIYLSNYWFSLLNCRRTLEIIEEEKILYAEKDEQKESQSAKLSSISIQPIPKTLITEEHESDQDVDKSKKGITEKWNKKY